MDDLLNNLIAAIIAPIVIYMIPLKEIFFKIRYHNKKHYIKKLKYGSLFNVMYVPISLLKCIFVGMIIYLLSYLSDLYFHLNIFKYFSNNVVSYCLFLFILLLLNFTDYRCNNLFKNNLIKPSVNFIYAFAPSIIYLLCIVFKTPIALLIFEILFMFIAFPFSSKIDTYIFHKMDIKINNGYIYKGLDAENVEFTSDGCTISESIDVIIYIPTSSIISKKYYSAEYEFDILHKFMLKHFSFFFCNQEKGL